MADLCTNLDFYALLRERVVKKKQKWKMIFRERIMLAILAAADSIKLYFFANEEFLCFFADKLGHFTIRDFFLHVT